MLNRTFKYAWLLGFVLMASVPVWAQRGQGRGMNAPCTDGTCCLALINSIPKQALDPTEAAGLAYMREEEKLAHDVYVTLRAKWGMRIFGNISQSEDRHFNAIKLLLDRYELPDPAANHALGVFENQGLREIYADLVKQGETSLTSAFRVGATIEDLNIHDLEKAAAATDNSDLKLVYQNFERASEDHMRTLVRQLTAAGESYTPQYISLASFSGIIASSQQSGIGLGARGTGQRGRGRGNNGVCPWR